LIFKDFELQSIGNTFQIPRSGRESKEEGVLRTCSKQTQSKAKCVEGAVLINGRKDVCYKVNSQCNSPFLSFSFQSARVNLQKHHKYSKAVSVGNGVRKIGLLHG